MGLAKELARQGASVAIADILPDNARKVADEINDAGGKAVAIECDVCDRSSIEQMKTEANAAARHHRARVRERRGDIVRAVIELTDSELDWMTEVNLKGVIWTALTFLPDMIEAGGGHIVATASMAGLIPTLVPVPQRVRRVQDGRDRVHAEHAARGRGAQRRLHALLPRRRAQRHAGQQREVPSRSSSEVPATSGCRSRTHRSRTTGCGSTRLRTSPRWCSRAVRNNRPFVFDHSEQRESFRELYSEIVEACFDDIEQWEQENGLSPMRDIQLPIGGSQPATPDRTAVEEGR